MSQKNKNILIGLALVLFGGLIGYVMTARQYGAGPLANLANQQSSASMSSHCPTGYTHIGYTNDQPPYEICRDRTRKNGNVYVPTIYQ